MSRASGQLPLSVFGAREDARSSSRQGLDGLFSVALFLVFILVVMVSLMVGTRIYSRLNRQQQQVEDSRLSMNVLVNSVRALDAVDCVQKGQGPEGTALVLVERLASGSYETRFYLFEGQLVQEYAPTGKPYAPDRATPIATSSLFEFAYEDGLLTLTTDTGSACVALRSARGGA